jgi:hypothetical protein
MMNAALRDDSLNLWTPSIKVPKGHKFMCDNLTMNYTGTVDCKQDTYKNTSYWTALGNYVVKTAPQPYWNMGYDISDMNFTGAQLHNYTFYNWIYQLFN